MQQLVGQIFKFLFFALAALIIGWTSIHTFDILYKTNPVQDNMFLAVYGLIVFEGGAIIWFGVFLKNAEGLGQHAISLMGVFVGVALVITAFILDYTVPAEKLIAYNSVARWAVILATSTTLVFVLLYELFMPSVWEDLQANIHVAMLHAKAEKKAQQMIDRDSDALANEIAENRKARAFANARLTGIKQIPTVSNQQKPMQPVRQFAAEAEEVRPELPLKMPEKSKTMIDIKRESGNGHQRPFG